MINYHTNVEESLKISLLQSDFTRWNYLMQVAALSSGVDAQGLKDIVQGVQKDFSYMLNDYLNPKSRKYRKLEKERVKLSDQDKMAFLEDTVSKPFNSLDEILNTLQKIKI